MSSARREPAGLGESGLELWTAYADTPLGAHQVALLTEACRLRDRLDKFDDVLRGELDTWMYLIADERDDQELHINVTDVVVKANQTATTMRLLLEKLPAPAAKPASGSGGSKPAPTTPLDEVQQRREKKAGSADGLTTRSRAAARRRRK